MGEVNNYVWDVNWGSAFPCANGAASSILTAYALSYAGHKILRMPEIISDPKPAVNRIPKSPSISKVEKPGVTANNIQKAKSPSVGALRELCVASSWF